MGIKHVVKFPQVKIKIPNVAILENAIYSKEKSSVSFGPTQTVKVKPDSSAKPKVRMVTNTQR